MRSTAGLRQDRGGAPSVQPAWFGPEGRRGVEDSRQRGSPRGLRSRFHAHEGEPCGEVEESGPRVPPWAPSGISETYFRVSRPLLTWSGTAISPISPISAANSAPPWPRIGGRGRYTNGHTNVGIGATALR